MCEQDKSSFRLIPFRPSSEALATGAPLGSPTVLARPRKRRLWDLDDHAHCPVIGVCMPIHTLRRLLRKCSEVSLPDNDYELHCLVVGASKSRTGLAELIQKDLDKRFQLSLNAVARLKSPAELAAHWQQVRYGPDVAGHFWALLTHPRISDELTQNILGDIHMLQHQIGTAQRVDHAQMETLLHENAVLSRALAGAQQRSQELVQNHTRVQARLEQEAMRLRAELITRQTEMDRIRQELDELRAATPDLPTRLSLVRTNQMQQERIQTLQRALNLAEKAPVKPSATLPATHMIEVVTAETSAPLNPAPSWQDRSVLCVGGRPNVIPIYRDLIEQTGAQFMHHDGGLEDNPGRLDHTLAAADLVICQAGCISHDAYWRVKQHCKRSNKPCVFVETPSKHAMERALVQLLAEDQPTS